MENTVGNKLIILPQNYHGNIEFIDINEMKL